MKKQIAAVVGGLFLALAVSVPVSALAPGDQVVPGGQAVGIRLDCKGVVVSGMAELPGDGGSLSPAAQAGLKSGDRIIRLNEQVICSGEDFLEAMHAAQGEPVTITAVRSGEERQFTVYPRQNDRGVWQLGLWLRSGVSGLGTVTFWDPDTCLYGALGHGVSLPEDGSLMVISGGEIHEATVTDVLTGQRGTPGELCGQTSEGETLGTVESNVAQGVFGHTAALTGGEESLPIAGDDEIRLGDAIILSTVDESGPREFDVEITRIARDGSNSRQLTLSVVDDALLSVTGGIVQGMSGSPILQDGKLIGAVTHVLLNDPSKGYGISMENMLAATAA